MPTLFMQFKLSRHQGFPPPSLVAAADLDKDGSANDDEFFLLTRDKLTWQGTLVFDGPTDVNGLIVMLSYNANPGCKMDVEIRSDGPEGALLNQTSRIVNTFPEVRFLRLVREA